MNDSCHECGKPYGKRRRCYFCHGRRPSGEIRKCAHCGKDFYAARWQLLDTDRRQGTYCSKPCMYASRQRGVKTGNRYRRTDGYIAVYDPNHPDASKSGWMLEHRLVAEQKYGRRIGKHEHVHHINHIKDDNRPENLEIIDPSVHAGISTRHGVELRRAQQQEIEALRAEIANYRKLYGSLPPSQLQLEYPSKPNSPGKLCQQCGTWFPLPAYRMAEAKYCSKACADAAKQQPILEKPCERCGTMFHKRWPSETAKSRFCSEACACRDMTDKRLAGYVPPDEKPCKRCGRMFRPEYQSNAELRQYCSRECWAERATLA